MCERVGDQVNPFKVKNEFAHYFSDDRREVSSSNPTLSTLLHLRLTIWCRASATVDDDDVAVLCSILVRSKNKSGVSFITPVCAASLLGSGYRLYLIL